MTNNTTTATSSTPQKIRHRRRQESIAGESKWLSTNLHEWARITKAGRDGF
jgi:hypothetical protein